MNGGVEVEVACDQRGCEGESVSQPVRKGQASAEPQRLSRCLLLRYSPLPSLRTFSLIISIISTVICYIFSQACDLIHLVRNVNVGLFLGGELSLWPRT